MEKMTDPEEEDMTDPEKEDMTDSENNQNLGGGTDSLIEGTSSMYTYNMTNLSDTSYI